MKLWDKKNKYHPAQDHNQTNEEEKNSAAAKAITDHRKFTTAIEEMINDHAKEGGFDNLEGKGKPLSMEYLQSDIMDGILKEAHVIPDWLILQHEIRDEIGKLKDALTCLGEHELQGEIKRINKMIVRFNNSVPTLMLQRGILFTDNIDYQFERWSK